MAISRLRSSPVPSSSPRGRSQAAPASPVISRPRLRRRRRRVSLQRVRCSQRPRRTRLHLRQDRPSRQLQVGRSPRRRGSVRPPIEDLLDWSQNSRIFNFLGFQFVSLLPSSSSFFSLYLLDCSSNFRISVFRGFFIFSAIFQKNRFTSNFRKFFSFQHSKKIHSEKIVFWPWPVFISFCLLQQCLLFYFFWNKTL